MKYYLCVVSSVLKFNKVLVFNSKEARAKIRKDFEKKNHFYLFEYEEPSMTLNELFVELVKANPLSPPAELHERAKEVYKLMMEQ